MARVTSRQVHVSFVTVRSDECHHIRGFHNQAGPPVLHGLDREAFARPRLQPPEAVIAIVGLALPMVLAANNQNVGPWPVLTWRLAAPQPDIVIRVEGIPVKRGWNT